MILLSLLSALIAAACSSQGMRSTDEHKLPAAGATGDLPEVPRQALANVVDGMGGHLALGSDGDKTVLIHERMGS